MLDPLRNMTRTLADNSRFRTLATELALAILIGGFAGWLLAWFVRMISSSVLGSLLGAVLGAVLYLRGRRNRQKKTPADKPEAEESAEPVSEAAGRSEMQDP